MKTYPVEINIKDPDTGEEGVIQATRLRSLKELGWHPTVEKLHTDADAWTVTHIPTGLAIAFFRTRAMASRFTLLVEKFDWDFNEADFEKYHPDALVKLKDWLIIKCKEAEKGGHGGGKKKVSAHTG